MKKMIVGIAGAGLFLIMAAGKSLAAETMTFDSTDHYLGGCQLTNKSEWQLAQEIKVTKFQVWYNWSQGETELPVKVYKEGELFAEFTAVRAECDPYQHQWCNADYKIDKVFPAGKYSTEIANSRQCLKPGGTGTIRLYKEDSAAEVPTKAPTPQPTAVTAQTQTNNKATTCACDKSSIVSSAAVTSGIVSFLLWLVLKRF